jgi:hypothetical protein
MPESAARLLAYARHELGCSFVLFDVDGDVLDGFAPGAAPSRHFASMEQSMKALFVPVSANAKTGPIVLKKYGVAGAQRG